jgi:hypothetical protein
MEIPIQAHVECTDGICGTSECVLINPVMEKVTHVLVKASASPHTEYMVPVALISETVTGTIHLLCSQAEFEKMEPFIQTRFIRERVPEYIGNAQNGLPGGYYWPYVSPDVTVYETVKDEQIPANEMAVYRGTRIEATDGYVGRVDEFMVNAETGQITHLVMREGHLWGKKDVVIPLEAMGETHEDTLLLKLDKHQIESLPTIPLHRHFS